MAIESIHSIGPKELGPQKNLEGEKAPISSNEQKAKSVLDTDEVQISQRAKALNDEFEALKTRAQTPSEESKQRIEIVKQRIDSGYYLQDSVLEKVADKILATEPFPSIIRDKSTSESLVMETKDAPAVRTDKITKARSRAAEGFYQQNEVLKVTAEKIVKDLFG